ncbi:uncharacterized protein LOC124340452 isoform X2 [Daphnia pulicaria]|uniref:uncharacterized protein LOC124340452 isoform X2 n=1 Tax=Daphnia pulicaria TaxID=35523 RepID=UPI001EEB5D31|nr:uncharacterized protein LOC124340452 isoform X2 [Daphnia pulicaria]
MMKLGWINVTFQPHLDVLSLTIALALVCCSAGNEGTEFSNKTTLHFNSSSLHHHTLNGSSPTTLAMAGFGHLNMNQSRDEKIHNLRAENQALTLVPTLNNTITTNHPTTSRVLDLEVANATISLPIKGNSSTNPWLTRKPSTHAETLNVTNEREIGINPEFTAGYREITIEPAAEQFHPRNGSSSTTSHLDWNSTSTTTRTNTSTEGTHMFDWNHPSSRLSTTTESVWGFPFHNSTDRNGGTFNSSTSSKTTTTTTPRLSSLWRNTTSTRPSAKKFLTGTPSQFSSKSERGEPWNNSETHGQNHFNSIVNVRVDSSAETLEKIIHLEAAIARKMGDMEKMARAMAGDLKSRLNRLEATLLGNLESRRSTEADEMKQHLESVIDVKSQTLRTELKNFKCAHHPDAADAGTVHAQTTNEPIELKIGQLRDSLPKHQPPMERQRNSDAKSSLAEWRAKRTKLMERWESNFQRGSQRKSTSKRSTRNLS